MFLQRLKDTRRLEVLRLGGTENSVVCQTVFDRLATENSLGSVTSFSITAKSKHVQELVIT